MTDKKERLKIILGLKVRYYRQQASLSFAQLAKISGMSVSYLNEIEKGKKYPQPDKIQTLAEALGTSYDQLVSQHGPKKLEPILNLINSDIFHFYPLELFGISNEKIYEVFAAAPDKTNAFVNTFLNIARHYQVDPEKLFSAALRSYQYLHDNYFKDLEESADEFRSKHLSKETELLLLPELKQHLADQYGIQVNVQEIGKQAELRNIRSIYSSKRKTLYLNGALSPAQKRFLLAKEIGFQNMDLKERPYISNVFDGPKFSYFLNNFRSSYFANALLIPQLQLVEDLKQWAINPEWNNSLIENLLKKYQITPEMLLHRFSNILPEFFNMKELFFIRHQSNDKLNYRMTKELHLSHLQQPYSNELNEHYCRRWVSVNTIKKLYTSSKIGRSKKYVIDAQVSDYYQTQDSYLCISIAYPDAIENSLYKSVTIGVLENDESRKAFGFLFNRSIKRRTVHTTCERCALADCEERIAPPKYIEIENDRKRLQQIISDMVD